MSFPSTAHSGQASLEHGFRRRERAFPGEAADVFGFPPGATRDDPTVLDAFGRSGECSGNPPPQIGSDPLRKTRLCRATLSQFIRVTVSLLGVLMTV